MNMKKLLVVVLFLMGMVQYSVAAETKAEADKAYQEAHYAKAAQIYESVLSTQGESAEVYYNLGNSYYKQKDIAKAILCYERALLINPSNADVRFNLSLAKSKAVDKITPMSEVFIVTWAKSVVNMYSEKQWSAVGIVSFILLLAGIALYLFGTKLVFKKIGFFAAVFFLLVAVLSNVCAYEQKQRLLVRNGAIVMSPTITVKSTPNESGTALFVLHEGTKVYVDDDSMKGWKEIRLEDGKQGWLPVSSIEKI